MNFQRDSYPDRWDGPIRVVHIDDDHEFVDAAAAYLNRLAGFEVTVVRDAYDVLDMASAGEVDCIVSDYQMPGMDGLELLIRVRAKHPLLPFILFTGQRDEELTRLGLIAGASDYLHKGFGTRQFDTLATRIASSIRRSHEDKTATATDARWQQLLELSHVGIYVVVDGVIQYANSRGAALFGYTSPTATGVEFTDLVAPADRERFVQLLATTDETSDTSRKTLHGLTDDGESFEIGLHTQPIEYGGRSAVLVTVFDDRSEASPLATVATSRRSSGSAEDRPTVVFQTDSDGRWTYLNQEWEVLSGQSVDETLGTPVADAVVHDDSAAIDALFTDLVARRTEHSRRDFRLRTATDDVRWIELSVVGTVDAEGVVVGTSGTLSDVTESRRYELAVGGTREHERVVLEHLRDVVLLLDPAEPRILYVNAAHEAMTGQPAERLYDDLWAFVETVHPDDRETLVADLEATFVNIRAGDPRDEYRYEYRVVPTNDPVRWMEARLSPLYDDGGEVSQLLAIVTDVTDRVEHEADLRRQADRLDEFAGVLSHDLRSPLTVAQYRLERAQETMDPDELAYVAVAHERITELIENVLSLARHGRQVDEPRPVVLGEVLMAAWQMCDTAEADLSVKQLPVVQGDESRLQELFENVFRNAIEHAGPGATVSIGSLAGVPGFYIEDDGPGIPPEKRGKVLETGFTTREEGTGFGLAIVRQVAEAHGWDVRVTESTSGGARFEFHTASVPVEPVASSETADD